MLSHIGVFCRSLLDDGLRFVDQKIAYLLYSFYNSGVIIIAISLVGNSIGFLTGSIFQDAQRAAAMAPALILPLMMFSGLYNKLNDIPEWIGWMQYLSPFKYGLHALLLN